MGYKLAENDPINYHGPGKFDPAAVVVLGESRSTNGEGKDVASLDLSGMQEELLRAVHATGTPTILVLINGRPLHYVPTDDGQFVLYSVGWNEKDDGGQTSIRKDGSVELDSPDWVWQMPAR